jgi:hypothetical protein
MAFYLYSKGGRAVILALMAALLPGAWAQSHKKDKGPRAIAVVELPKDAKASPRLVPIAILDDGKFYDASVYLASPVPLALDSGVVYEAERSGQSAGFFTVEGARQVNGDWVALGNWKLRGSETKKVARKSSGPQVPYRDEEDKPPVLRRGSSQPTPPASTPAPTSEKKTSPPKPASQTQAGNNPIPPASEQVDPDRPTLRRGKPPEVEHEDAEFNPPSVKTASGTKPAPGAAKPEPAALFREVLVAVSDAHGPQPKPFDYPWTSEEKQQLTKKIADLASQELVRYAKSKPGLKYPPASTFDQFDIKAFDLLFDNNPVLVFSGQVPGSAAPPVRRGKVTAAKSSSPAPNFFYYVTVVARQLPDGVIRKLYSSVTDSGHLDAFPRMQLVDAVDAEGNGLGDLLFRATSDQGRSYVLYRVARDSLWKLFEGGSAAQ